MQRNTTSKVTDKVKRSRTFLTAIEEVMVRRKVFLLATMLAMLVLASGVAMAAVFQGTGGEDEYYGTTQNDTIYGYGGNDTLYGSPPGREGSGVDSINGGVGNDVMDGRLGADSIAGGPGNDWMADGPIKDGLRDKLSGSDGNDTIISNNYPRAADTITCGTGSDTVYADSSDTFTDRQNCERVTIYNPRSATDPAAAYPIPDNRTEPEEPEPCDLDPTIPCEPDSRPRFR